MTSTTLDAAPLLAGTDHRGGRRAFGVRGVLRVVTGLLLAVTLVGALAGAAYVVLERVGFSPVLSPSMRPTFAPGDLVVTKPEAATAIRVGQVVVLPVPGEAGQRYVHRIIKVSWSHGQPVVRTKGDANAAPESYSLRVTSRQVPVVVTTVPRVGRLALLLRGGMLRVGIICVIGFLMLVSVKRFLLDR
jgi:signal peptidase I